MCGGNKYKEKVEHDLERNPLMFGQFPGKQKEYDQYKAVDKAVDLCDNIQNFYWRVMMTVPESCPK